MDEGAIEEVTILLRKKDTAALDDIIMRVGKDPQRDRDAFIRGAITLMTFVVMEKSVMNSTLLFYNAELRTTSIVHLGTDTEEKKAYDQAVTAAIVTPVPPKNVYKNRFVARFMEPLDSMPISLQRLWLLGAGIGVTMIVIALGLAVGQAVR